MSSPYMGRLPDGTAVDLRVYPLEDYEAYRAALAAEREACARAAASEARLASALRMKNFALSGAGIFAAGLALVFAAQSEDARRLPVRFATAALPEVCLPRGIRERALPPGIRIQIQIDRMKHPELENGLGPC